MQVNYYLLTYQLITSYLSYSKIKRYFKKIEKKIRTYIVTKTQGIRLAELFFSQMAGCYW